MIVAVSTVEEWLRMIPSVLVNVDGLERLEGLVSAALLGKLDLALLLIVRLTFVLRVSERTRCSFQHCFLYWAPRELHQNVSQSLAA